MPWLFLISALIIFLAVLLFGLYFLLPIFFSIFSGGPPFVTTPMPVVRKMLELANLKAGDIVYDLGCGDGRLVIEAADKYRAKAIGVEASFFVWLRARLRRLVSRSNAVISKKNMFETDLADADAVFCYLFPETMERLKEKFTKELKPGARIISHAFAISGWKPVYRTEERPFIFIYEMGVSDK